MALVVVEEKESMKRAEARALKELHALNVVQSGTELADLLDDIAKSLGRRLRVYVVGHKERPKSEIDRLMKRADVAVAIDGWTLLDDPSRYEWVNQ